MWLRFSNRKSSLHLHQVHVRVIALGTMDTKRYKRVKLPNLSVFGPRRHTCPMREHLFVLPQVLLIRRAKPPSMGMWSFPGGSLELGEAIVDCAVREVKEETGVMLANATTAPDSAPPHLLPPLQPFALNKSRAPSPPSYFPCWKP